MIRVIILVLLACSLFLGIGCAAHQVPRLPAKTVPESILKSNAYGLFLRARAYEYIGDPASALEGYRAVCEVDSSALYPLYLVARGDAELGRNDIALRAMEFVLARDTFPEYLSLYGTLLVRLNRFPEAVSVLTASLRKQPDDLRMRELLAAVYERMERPDSAAILYETLLSVPELKPSVQEKLVVLYARAGHLNDAFELLKEVLEENPKSNSGRVNLFLLSDLYKPVDSVLALYRVTASKDSDNFTLLKDWAAVAIRHERYLEAERLFVLMKARFPDEVDMRVYGALLEGLGKHQEAIVALTSALSVSPDPALYFYLGNANLSLRKYPAAIQAYDSVLVMDTLHFGAFINRGLAFMRSGGLDSAEAVFLRAENRYPQEAECDHLLGMVYAEKKEFVRAKTVFEKAIVKDSSQVEFRFNLASALERLGSFNEAESLFLTLIQRDSTHHRALNYLGYMYADRGVKLEQAEKLIGMALKLEPENFAYMDSYAWVLYRKGDYLEAQKYLAKAIATHEADPVVYEHQALLFEALKKPDAALEYWRKVIELEPTHEKALQALGIKKTPAPLKP